MEHCLDELSVEDLAKYARASLSSYCMNTCQAKCCKVGKLLIEKKELHEKLNKKHVTFIQTQYGTSFELQNGCPFLTKQSKCSIFTEHYRPKMCDEFPIFVRGNTILFSTFCAGQKAGLLDEYEELFRKKGCIIFHQ